MHDFLFAETFLPFLSFKPAPRPTVRAAPSAMKRAMKIRPTRCAPIQTTTWSVFWAPHIKRGECCNEYLTMDPPCGYSPTLAFVALSHVQDIDALDDSFIVGVLISEEASLIPYANRLAAARRRAAQFYDKFKVRAAAMVPLSLRVEKLSELQGLVEESRRKLEDFEKAVASESGAIELCERSIEHYHASVVPTYRRVYDLVSLRVFASSDVRRHVSDVLSGSDHRSAANFRNVVKRWVSSIGKDTGRAGAWDAASLKNFMKGGRQEPVLRRSQRGRGGDVRGHRPG
jgi:hypothetical protein